ncbi:MAG: TadE/TadG family type IV pilus assembly protein [Hyphomonadaceae bacterium]
MRSFLRFRQNQTGAALVEHTLVFMMLMILTFGLIEFGIVLYQYNAAEKATAVGARFIATRGPVVTGLPDCGPGVNVNGMNAGATCPATNWETVCNASAPSGGCQAAVLNALVVEMQRFSPDIEAQNVQVVLRGAGLGFVGRGSPVPMVTVRLTGMQYDFIALDDLLGFGTLTMPGFDATVVGEDLNGAGA